MVPGSVTPLNALEFVGGLVVGVLLIAALAVVARELLGVRVGAVRTLLAGAIGYVIAALVSTTMDRSAEPFVFLSVLVGVQLLVSMVCLVVVEAVVPSGSHPVRDLRRRIGRTRRYLQIIAIAVRHGLGPYLRGRRSAVAALPQGRARLARSLRMALEEAGVTFIKLGQLLSTRKDLLALEVVDELSRLQERVPPAPWPSVQAVLDEELGAVDSIFAAFDPVPLAGASIAQVHGARLRSGEDVVVKVQRPASSASSIATLTSCCGSPRRSRRGAGAA